MNNLRRDALAVLGCLAIIVIAFFAHSGLRNGTFYLPLLGYILDAIVVTGVIGNLVVFLLVKATKRNPLRIALWTFVIIHGLGLALSFLLGMQVEPQFNFGGVILGYVASFLFWFGLHWIWAHRNRGQVTA
ncbi:MAG TPA: hypothetical protein VJS64_13265 [Pyrinomonadaceae bacterium]|nr:hypothetical protein [Pyrinomonadaceae bacterium]